MRWRKTALQRTCNHVPTIVSATLLSLAAVATAQWVEDSVYVWDRIVGDLAYNSREDVVYGATESGNNCFAIDCSSLQVIAGAPVQRPHSVVYDSTDNKAYCSSDDAAVVVIDGATHQRVDDLPIDGAGHLLWDRVVNRLYVSCYFGNRVAVIDCASDSLVTYVSVGREPCDLNLNTRRRKLYVDNHGSETVSVVDLELLRVVATIPLPTTPDAGCYSPLADKYYCGGGGGVLSVCGAGDTAASWLELGPGDVRAIIPVGSSRFVFAAKASTVHVIDTRVDTVVSTVAVQPGGFRLHWSPDSRLVYASGSDSDSVTVLNEQGTGVVRTLAVGDCPYELAASPVQRRVFVSHLNGRYVYVIKDRAGGVAEQEPVRVERLPGPTVMRAAELARVKGTVLDAAGRDVTGQRTGLSPGVYFLRHEARSPRDRPDTRRVILAQ